MNKLNLTVIISVVVVIAGLLIAVAMITNLGEKKTISSSGNAEMTVDPDQAVVYLNIETRSSSADDAKNDNAEISDDVIAALEAIGVDKDDIETENFNIHQEYDWIDGQRKLKGYVARNNIKITTEDFENVGKIIDASVDNGALVNYINFELSNKKMNEYKAMVLAEASQDARTKAQAIASGLGKNIGDIVRVSASDYDYMPYPVFRMETAEAGADVKEIATDISPKKLDVRASVNVEFELK